MNNTNLGAAMGAFLPSQSSSVDRTQKVEASTKATNENGTKDFKKSMASAEQSAEKTPADKAPADKAIEKPVKESTNVSATENDSHGTKTDADTRADGEMAINTDNNEPVVNSVKSPFSSEVLSAEVFSTETISPEILSGLSESQEVTGFMLVNSLDSEGLSGQSLQMPVLPELSFAVQQVIHPSSRLQNGAGKLTDSLLNTSPLTTSPLTTLSTTVSPALMTDVNVLPITQLASKLFASSIAELSEGAGFDVSAALNKETEKSLASPLMAITPMVAKPSVEALLPGQLSLNTSFQSAGQWGEAVTEKVMWMSSKGIKEATIQLDPPELGSLQVKVSVHQDQAQVSFTVQHASVREALDQQSMRLREMFAEDGLTLTDVDVSDQSSQEEPGEQPAEESREESNRNRFSQDSNDEQNDVLVTPLHSESHPYSLIDAYI